MFRFVFSLFLCFSLVVAAIAGIRVVTDNPSGIECVDLFAGQHIDVGEVCAEATPDGLCIRYQTSGDWYLDETHLWVGLNLSEMPQNRKGNPKIGHFPYGDSVPGSQFYEVCIPYSDLGLDEQTICAADQLVLFAAHASVYREVDGQIVQTETGWSDGSPIVEKGNWSTFSSITLSCDDGPEPPLFDDCETAFAFGDVELDDLPDPLDPSQPLTSRWGWQITMQVGDTLTTPIFAGAGQNDVTKGTYVGDLLLSYDGQVVDATYQMFPEFVMTETHLFVGDSNIETAAPGQFGNLHENLETQTDLYEVWIDAPEIYVVAHAVVCKLAE